MNIQTASLDAILAAYVSRVLAAQARRLGSALGGSAYSGLTPPEPVVDFIAKIKEAKVDVDAGPFLKILADNGLGDWSAWYASLGAARAVPISAATAGPVFVTPTVAGHGYEAGEAVLVVHGSRALKPDLTIGCCLPPEAGLRAASHAEVLATLTAWARGAELDLALASSGAALLDAWADYSVAAADEAFGIDSDADDDEEPEAAAPASLDALFDRIGLSSDLRAIANVIAAKIPAADRARIVSAFARESAPAPARASAPAAPASGPLPELPGLVVLVPTFSSGSFRSGAPVLVIGATDEGGYLVWDGSAVVSSPAGVRREHVRPANRSEAHAFLTSFGARIASAAVTAV